MMSFIWEETGGKEGKQRLKMAHQRQRERDARGNFVDFTLEPTRGPTQWKRMNKVEHVSGRVVTEIRN